MDILDLARRNQQKAWKIIEDTKIIPAWESVGARVNLVGSLNTGLLMKHLDIDFLIYTPQFSLSDSFQAIVKLTENKSFMKMKHKNLLDNELWQIDMIHILEGSRYDGYFEKFAERLSAVLTEETKYAILKLKYETPESEKIMGVEYYVAVIRDGIRSYEEFMEWRIQHPVTGVMTWMP